MDSTLENDLNEIKAQNRWLLEGPLQIKHRWIISHLLCRHSMYVFSIFRQNSLGFSQTTDFKLSACLWSLARPPTSIRFKVELKVFIQISIKYYSASTNAKGDNISNIRGMQHMLGKPGIFHGRDQLVQELAHLLLRTQHLESASFVPAEWPKLVLLLRSPSTLSGSSKMNMLLVVFGCTM
jgi:hypothetical protein